MYMWFFGAQKIPPINLTPPIAALGWMSFKNSEKINVDPKCFPQFTSVK